MTYKCIIFDIGYTLVKHNNEIESKMMSEILNIPYSKEFENQVARFWKNSGELTKDKIINKEMYCNLIQKMFPYIKKYNIKSLDFFKALCEKGEVGKYEETDEILDYLYNKNYTLVSLSNWFSDDQEKELRNLKILKYFTNIFGWDNTYAKPNPITIKEKLLNKYQKNELILVGNSLDIDIQCGINAGIDTVWYNLENQNNKSDIKPTYEISNLLELKNIL